MLTNGNKDPQLKVLLIEVSCDELHKSDVKHITVGPRNYVVLYENRAYNIFFNILYLFLVSVIFIEFPYPLPPNPLKSLNYIYKEAYNEIDKTVFFLYYSFEIKQVLKEVKSRNWKVVKKDKQFYVVVSVESGLEGPASSGCERVRFYLKAVNPNYLYFIASSSFVCHSSICQATIGLQMIFGFLFKIVFC